MMIMQKYTVDLYPSKAQFILGELISMELELTNLSSEDIVLNVDMKVNYLTEMVDRLKETISVKAFESKSFILPVKPQNYDFRGFGVDVYLYKDDTFIEIISSSFDVAFSYKKAMRYGFLSDFYLKDSGDIEDIKSLRKLHLNLIQFYDWMYKHDELVPPVDEFKDLMGRTLSFKVVLDKIKACHKYGMKAMAYGAVYAASKDFYETHKDWALFNSSDKPVSFIDIFQIMNISKDCPWHWHIINEYKKAIEKADFDGIHMDTYGFPKIAISKINVNSKIEYLEDLFPVLINDAKKELRKVKEDVCLIFNNVGNWPLNTVAKADQEAMYIEVWKPYERYHHLKEIITAAKHLSDGKPVILAAYLKPFMEEIEIAKAETSALIATAVISANGAYHLLMGEKNGVLTQGYYVDYSTISESFFETIRKYYDFGVRYENILYDNELRDVSMTHLEGDNLEYKIENLDYSTYGEADKVWVIAREKPTLKTINFVNLTGNQEDFWNKGKDKPRIIKDVVVNVSIELKIKNVFIASPDIESGRPQKLKCKITNGERGKVLIIEIPELSIWSMLCIEFE
jgi:dextranase